MTTENKYSYLEMEDANFAYSFRLNEDEFLKLIGEES
jgi:hypothetical protein